MFFSAKAPTAFVRQELAAPPKKDGLPLRAEKAPHVEIRQEAVRPQALIRISAPGVGMVPAAVLPVIAPAALAPQAKALAKDKMDHNCIGAGCPVCSAADTGMVVKSSSLDDIFGASDQVKVRTVEIATPKSTLLAVDTAAVGPHESKGINQQTDKFDHNCTGAGCPVCAARSDAKAIKAASFDDIFGPV